MICSDGSTKPKYILMDSSEAVCRSTANARLAEREGHDARQSNGVPVSVYPVDRAAGKSKLACERIATDDVRGCRSSRRPSEPIREFLSRMNRM
jgi:hypothetical protein